MFMRRKVFALAGALCGVVGFTLATSARAQAGAAPATPEEVRRVSVEETQKALTDGSAVLIDVRGDAAYQTEHIKGALNAAPGSDAFQKLPKEKLIIAYCT